MASDDARVTVPQTATTGPVPGARRSVVMRDVALLAGVSHQTVSRVLNGHASVRPETRSRVLDANGSAQQPAQPSGADAGHPTLEHLGLVAIERLRGQSVDGIVAIAPKNTVAQALGQAPAALSRC